MTDEAMLVLVGGSKKNHWLGPLAHWARMRLASVRASQTAVPLLARVNKADSATLRELLAAGTIRPIMDREYPLTEIVDALRYLSLGHAKGKVVLRVCHKSRKL